MIGLREDQRVGAQLAARIVIFLNATTFQCGSGFACESAGSPTGALNDTPQSQASLLPQWRGHECHTGGWVCSIEGRWLTSAYQAASLGLASRHCRSGWRKSR